jgi:hypothetical protein
VALSIDELLAVEDRPITAVRIPAWNAEVLLRVMTGVERDSMSSMQDNKTKPTVKEMRRALFVRGLCDADGNRLPAHVIEKLLEKSGVALEQLSQEIANLNGLNEASREKLLGKPEENSGEATDSSG